jgi:tRNA-uridine 2-sulfurtransferase
MKNKVFVAISGGVDSAVTAALLKKQGYDVTGVFMKNWSSVDFGISDECPWEKDLEDTIDICKTLDIPHKTYNFEKEYREYILENFFNEYERGNTPNPDVLCNKYIKFDSFLKKALSEGADLIATGHYSKTNGGKLFKANDKSKDQTYFLYQLSKEQLQKSLFPLGHLTKKEVRELAKEFKLPVAEKKDSQGLCFVGKVNIKDFLKNRLQEQEGDIIDISTGEIVGKHKGVWFYTNGQRQGIGIGGKKEPYFVAERDVKKNILYVAEGKDSEFLWKKKILIKNIHLIDPECTLPAKNLTGTLRYRSPDTSIKIEREGQNYIVLFDKPQWAPAVGQSLVIFNQEECIGGGVIANVF